MLRLIKIYYNFDNLNQYNNNYYFFIKLVKPKNGIEPIFKSYKEFVLTN